MFDLNTYLQISRSTTGFTHDECSANLGSVKPNMAWATIITN